MGGFDFQGLLGKLQAVFTGNMLLAATLVFSLWLLTRTRFFKRISRAVEDILFSNWQLGLLATTGIILSAASGWTTWDGMRNFTGEPILSGMITFGIQGVMLIVAWLIGESFATGMSQQTANGVFKTEKDWGLMVAMTALGLGIVVAAATWASKLMLNPRGDYVMSWFASGGLVLLGLFIVASKMTTLRGYFDAMRVMVQSSVLWIMFLACMATSVFFSFDSLFSTIFPMDERKRAAELRAQNQVAGIVSDIGNLISTRQLTEAENLFTTKGWDEYDKQMQLLSRVANESRGQIEQYFNTQMEQRRQSIAQQQERIATSQSSQAGLSNKKGSLTDELARLKSERPGMVEDVTQKREVVEATIKEVDAKRVEVLAEEKGVEGTGKIGRGQMFRQRKTEEDSLREKLKIAEERLREPQKKLQATETRIVQIERELSGLDGDLAKLKGEAQTAESRIKLAEEAKSSEESLSKIDPSRMVPVFEKARQEFRQQPRADGLIEIQRQCVQLVTAIGTNPATKDRVRGIDCDPKGAAESAARVFSLNDGIKTFTGSCAGGDKLNQYKTADALFDFARKCVQESGLASKDTDDLRQKVNFIELNRDDKANRFVVTWNAFQDGNRLAYLALAIAVAIDALIFMSGLFAANAVRSPLSDVPTNKARSADQLEAIIDNALLPSRFENARVAIEAMQADTAKPGYSAIVDLAELDPERQLIVGRVLNAGATINAVFRDERNRGRYYIRPELFEYLSIAGNKAFEKHGEFLKEDIGKKLELAQLEKDVSVALLPEHGAETQAQLNYHIAIGAQNVLDHLHPWPDPNDTGYRSELRLSDFEEKTDLRKARRVLTAGSNMRLVQASNYKASADLRDSAATPRDGHYLLHTDFVKTLTRLRARMLLGTSSSAAQLAGPGHNAQSAAYGGSLNAGNGRAASPAALPGHASPQSKPQLGYVAAPQRLSTPPPQQPVDDPFGLPPMQDLGIPPLAETDAGREAFVQHRPVQQPVSMDAELDRQLVEHFASEMGQQSSTIEYLVRHNGQIEVARLWQSLDLVLRHDENGLKRPMAAAMKSLERSIDDARGQFPSTLMTGPGATTAVNDFADKLKTMTVVMVMLPGAAYDNLINRMEMELEEDKGGGRLDPAKVEKHRIIVAHRSELARAEYSDDHWDSVLQSLMKFEHGLSALAGSDQRPTRLV